MQQKKICYVIFIYLPTPLQNQDRPYCFGIHDINLNILNKLSRQNVAPKYHFDVSQCCCQVGVFFKRRYFMCSIVQTILLRTYVLYYKKNCMYDKPKKTNIINKPLTLEYVYKYYNNY